MADYRLTPAANRDLKGIWTYTRNRWSAEQADHYIESLVKVFAELAQRPAIAQACDDFRPGYRRRHIGRHMIYFQVTSYGVTIVRVLHERMNATRRLSVKPP